jgi:hypothetical protein
MEGLKLTGWGLFLLSAVAFVAQGIRAGDVLGVIASLLFLVGVIVLMVPMIKDRG